MDEHTMYVYEQGLVYLQKLLPNDVDGQRILEREKLYWNWWRLRWNKRDEIFNEHFSEFRDLPQLVDVYLDLNDGAELINDIRPPFFLFKTLRNVKSSRKSDAQKMDNGDGYLSVR